MLLISTYQFSRIYKDEIIFNNKMEIIFKMVINIFKKY